MITVKTHLAIMDDGFETNTYIVTDEETGETLVVDPSLPEEKLIEKLNPEKVKYILITHGHFDHIGGVNFVKASSSLLCSFAHYQNCRGIFASLVQNCAPMIR
jgi:glyoxylase-like metal-dependent hydrolase (beta-lactamase superfamily II)